MQPTRVKTSSITSLLQGSEIIPLSFLLEAWAGLRNELVSISDKRLDSHVGLKDLGVLSNISN